jgi:transposase-like protein
MPNAIESLNSVIRAAATRYKVCPSGNSAQKVKYLFLRRSAKIDEANSGLVAGVKSIYDRIW